MSYELKAFNCKTLVNHLVDCDGQYQMFECLYDSLMLNFEAMSHKDKTEVLTYLWICVSGGYDKFLPQELLLDISYITDQWYEAWMDVFSWPDPFFIGYNAELLSAFNLMRY